MRAGAPSGARGVAAWVGFPHASHRSGGSRARGAVTRAPNPALFTAAQPPLPTNRIGTVTTAASAAASSADLVAPSTVAFDSTLEASSSTCQGCANTLHWLAPRRPNAVT